MDYEKAYKAVLQTATQWIKDGCTDKEKICLECVFPELRESEDERIRRELIEYLRGDLDDITTDDTDRWINWIEKQKDCILVPKSHLDPVGKLGVDGMKILEKQKEQKNPLEDYSRGYNDGYYHGIIDNTKKEQKELPLMNGDADLYFDEWNQQKQNPTKRQCFEEGIRYARRLEKEQKPAWSEEDQLNLNWVIAILNGEPCDLDIQLESLISWLKSLRPSWKPSEEQLNALNFAITYFMHETNYKNPTELRDLYDDLLKLQ